MKHKNQMSLILRRAQIRRAVADRKDAPMPRMIQPPQLRLVFSSGALLPPKSGREGGGRLYLVN